MTVRQALIADCIFEAAGAISMGPSVVGTISGGEVYSSKWADAQSYFALLMFAVLVGAGSTTLLATMYGLPISATHGVISGVIACALVAETTDALSDDRAGAVNWWPGFGMTVVGWVASPVVGMLAGMLVSLIVYKLVIGARDPAEAARKRQPALLAGTVAIIVSFVLLKGPAQLSDPFINKTWLALLVAVATGTFIASVLLAYQHLSCAQGPTTRNRSTSKDQGDQVPALGVSYDTTEEAEIAGSSSSSDVLVTERDFDDVQKPFVPLLIAAGLTVAFAHGGNDVGNAVGPLSTIIYIRTQHPHSVPGDDDGDTAGSPWVAIAVGTVAFVVGILTLGSRTIETVGSSITELTPSRSFATQIGAAVAVLGSSTLALPVSTSHCLVGAVVGVNLMEGWCRVEGAKELDFKVLRKIVIGWIVTIPLAAGVSVIVLLLFQKPFIS